MTDLTITQLQQLLDQATQGPWEVEDTNSDAITDQNGDGVLWNADQAVGWSRRDEDVSLAALAPELAEEVIRQRGEIKGLITAMEVKAATGESQSPATIAGYLKEIVLGEDNEHHA
ncbi:hypothetical protein QPX34_07090 [Corynebacterium accolens]|uniref:DUF222 domain-containing protein n=1 Tax=Corynebacterium accolens TaxID=38284 RepID=A0ABT7FQN0_9CORY|nr:hypothetical protein [Corynebacterium accolens]MDK4247790.1 hypothetical protein [Corynebacterium accolens]